MAINNTADQWRKHCDGEDIGELTKDCRSMGETF